MRKVMNLLCIVCCFILAASCGSGGKDGRSDIKRPDTTSAANRVLLSKFVSANSDLEHGIEAAQKVTGNDESAKMEHESAVMDVDMFIMVAEAADGKLIPVENVMTQPDYDSLLKLRSQFKDLKAKWSKSKQSK